jgi:energy-coupling factor transporter ATP-binding protein EcfA2
VKCFADVELRFQSAAETGDPQSNWNVILGENGDGKTTLLKGIAACLMDATTADRMLRPTGWVRGKAEVAALDATIVPQSMDLGEASLKVREIGYLIVQPTASNGLATPTLTPPDAWSWTPFGHDASQMRGNLGLLANSAFSRGHSGGWMSAGYGPHRRPAGSSEPPPSKDVLERRFGTLFDERQPLYDCESWLKELDRRALKAGKSSIRRRTFDDAKEAVKSLLPGVEDILVEDEVSFKWHGERANVDQLSQGYRSMFVLAVDMLRWMEETRSTPEVSLREVQGVVLVDEIDAHLHPEWQRRVGFMLCKTFPNIQFIVASHSPFVAMAAGKKALTLLERSDDVVTANQDVPYVRGWSVGRVLSELFSQLSQRDPETEARLEEYEKLRTARTRRPLPKKKAERLAELEAYLEERLRGDRDALPNREMDASLSYFAKALKEREAKHHA